MKHLLPTTVATAACSTLILSTPATAQVQADYLSQVAAGCIVSEDGQRVFPPEPLPEGVDDWICLSGPAPFESDEVVVIADRLGFRDNDDLTVPASVLTQAEIEARGQQYVADLLRALPGIAISQSGSGGGLTQLRVRGAEANQVLVLIDGVEVANPNSGEFDLSGLRAQDVVKIEVLRGEQSALYGSDAVAGVISIVTRAGETIPRWRASVEGGSRGTAQGQFSAVVPVAGAALSINGNAFRTDGFDVAGLGGEKDGSRSRGLNVGLNDIQLGGLRLDAKYDVSILDSEFDGDTDFDGRLNDTNGETERRREVARLGARFETGAVEHRVSGSWAQTDTDTTGGFSSRSIGERANVSWISGIDTHQHDVTVLAEYERETYQLQPNPGNPDAKPQNETAAIAADYRFTNGDLVLSASARHDINDLFSDATTWRLGAGYDFLWNGRLRGSVGTGIKNPTLIELFGFFPESRFTGNPNLQPERSLGVSIGYEQTIGDFHASVDWFRSELEDEIATRFNPDSTSTVFNLDTESTRQGIELEARYRFGDWSLNGAATFLDSEENGVSEIRRPEFTASASASWQASPALLLSAFVDHTGDQLDTDFGRFDTDTGTFTNVTLDDYTLVGARAQWSVTDNVALSLRGANLLDQQYQELVGYASPGRAVFAGLELDF